MKEEDIELAKQEFNRDRDRWTDLLLTRRFYYADLQTRLTDRQINHTLTLTTIAIAVISVIFPLIGKSSPISTIALLLLSLSAILGTALVLYTVFKDKKGIPKIRDEELNVYSKFQSASMQNYNKAYSGEITWNDVKSYFELRGQIEKELKSKKENKLVEIIIDTLYITFLASFFLGLGSLLLLILCIK